MKGKEKCKALKEIRKQIAENNNIEYVVSECKHKGECKGTCPKCEAEVRYLERELEKRRNLGQKIAIAGVSMGIAASMSACSPGAVIGASAAGMPGTVVYSISNPVKDIVDPEPLGGEALPVEPYDIMGEYIPEDEDLSGDVDYCPDDDNNSGNEGQFNPDDDEILDGEVAPDEWELQGVAEPDYDPYGLEDTTDTEE